MLSILPADSKRASFIVHQMGNNLATRTRVQTGTAEQQQLKGKLTNLLSDRKHPKSLPPEETCVICLNHYGQNDNICKLECDHMFHEVCITDWLIVSMSCPVCRTDVKLEHPSTKPPTVEDVNRVYNDAITLSDDPRLDEDTRQGLRMLADCTKNMVIHNSYAPSTLISLNSMASTTLDVQRRLANVSATSS